MLHGYQLLMKTRGRKMGMYCGGSLLAFNYGCLAVAAGADPRILLGRSRSCTHQEELRCFNGVTMEHNNR